MRVKAWSRSLYTIIKIIIKRIEPWAARFVKFWNRLENFSTFLSWKVAQKTNNLSNIKSFKDKTKNFTNIAVENTPHTDRFVFCGTSRCRESVAERVAREMFWNFNRKTIIQHWITDAEVKISRRNLPITTDPQSDDTTALKNFKWHEKIFQTCKVSMFLKKIGRDSNRVRLP